MSRRVRPFWLRVLKITFIAGIIACLLSFAVLVVTVAFFYRNLPSPEEIRTREVRESTKIYDRTGSVLLYEVHGEEKRTVIQFEDIPAYMKQATLAIEDQNFYNHPAFDWRGIARAVLVNLRLREGYVGQGGSTITQQLAKKAFLSDERTLVRKLKELLLAFRLEEQYTKDQILHLYLNQIPYGSNAYGIEAAAKTYFGKSARELTLNEAATLASLSQAPTYYSPWGTHTDELLTRKNYALTQMRRLNYITEDEERAAKAEKIKFIAQTTAIAAPHFVIAVQDYLSKKYGEETLEKGGLSVITALDARLQEIAEQAVAEGAKRNEELYKGKNAALFAEDPKTGQVLAMVGSRDYFDVEAEGNFNVATQGLRQPGSAFKPFAYVTAFKKGYTPETVVFDLETEFDASGLPERSYKPGNFDELFRGPISLRNALAQSINIPAVKVMYLAGIDTVLKTASDFGINTLTERSRYGLSLVLGGGEVKLSEMVHAYGVFADDGFRHSQTLVLEVKNNKGEILEQYEDKPIRVIEQQYVRLINDILSDTEARSPLFDASLNLTIFEGREVALKTGTTNNYIDAWSIGYTPSLVAGVWAGNNHREPLQKRGGSILAAVPIWSEFMKAALQEMPQEIFPAPEPYSATKPILKGNYIAGNQVHSILYFLDKDDPQGPIPTQPESDPQFSNWETPVIDWAKRTIPNFESIFNKPGAGFENDIGGNIDINIIKPSNGDFVEQSLEIVFDITSATELRGVEVYWNDSLVEKRDINQGTAYHYERPWQINNLNTQNSLKIKATAQNGDETERILVLFRK